ncbi:MAG: aminotransferase class I/II-fold pyridoxal phosphate-dependent enzyme, partial [Chloroflexota bacterium]
MVNKNDSTPQGSPHHGDNTQSVHAGTSRNKALNSLTTPIVQSATYTFENTADLIAFLEAKTWGNGEKTRDEYGRYGNPTVSAVEKRLAALEGTDGKGETDAVLFSSGMAAITTLLLTVLKAGQHVVMTDDVYRRTRIFCEITLAKFGIDTSVVPVGDYDALENAVVKGKTRLIISETPTNPYLRVTDLERIK